MTKKYITGFSIMELIIVLLISSIISLVVLPNYEKVQTYAKENTSKNQLYNLQLAIETYFLTNNMYPNATTINELILTLKENNLLKNELKNPFTNAEANEIDESGNIHYASPSPHDSYTIEVFGKENLNSLLILTN